ncbi:hypothetical protein [Microbacterium azadirachtae]|uniref:DUF4279 domain-containing protein n=1 Tax=Microbacterium azadirachtae TaxID=582680 RepID=A0A0F0LJU2_9MICO|nr:hypothetical protein [Microbacterium azadirachtae]KJL32949.1 hypothetical protein RS86_02123 [Microbacterium azadirachtae]
MITSDIASLVVRSETRDVAEITSLLGFAPTGFGDRGDPTPSGIAGRKLKPEYLVYQETYWAYRCEIEPADDSTGFASLASLVALLLPRANALAILREDGETRIWWGGLSDSTQGGFVMTAALQHDLALLGCDLFGTTYLNEDDAEPAT